MTSPVKVKICGVMRPADARAAAERGADFVGVILAPGFERTLEPEVALGVLDACGCRRVGVFVDPDPREAVEVARALSLDVVQLHGQEPPAAVSVVGRGGAWDVWKAVRIGREQGRTTLVEYDGIAQGALLDTWHPTKAGGTGDAFDWGGVGQDVRRGFDGILVVAGGLSPSNVCEAIRVLQPDVVDVSSGVERSVGVKDPDRVGEFIQRARRCGAQEMAE